MYFQKNGIVLLMLINNYMKAKKMAHNRPVYASPPADGSERYVP
jgi:hypothetical protein